MIDAYGTFQIVDVIFFIFYYFCNIIIIVIVVVVVLWIELCPPLKLKH